MKAAVWNHLSSLEITALLARLSPAQPSQPLVITPLGNTIVKEGTK